MQVLVALLVLFLRNFVISFVHPRNVPGMVHLHHCAMSSNKANTKDDDGSGSPPAAAAAVWCPDQQIYVGGIVPGATNEDVRAMIANNSGYLRVFGYGSLCWNPGDPAETALGHASVTSQSGYAKNYRRCWAQKSTDHRGTAVFPGIVRTLLQNEEVDAILAADPNSSSRSGRCQTEGMIYVVPPELVKTCLEELDFREKGGYAREIITVVEDSTGLSSSNNNKQQELKEVSALLYRGTPDNPAF